MSIAKWLLAKKLGGGSPFPPVIKRVTGNPIEFSDGADAPLVKCVTQITGSQDLHGYDKPWVGGAGKNKLDLIDASLESGTIIISNGTIKINGSFTNKLVNLSSYVNLAYLNDAVINQRITYSITMIDGEFNASGIFFSAQDSTYYIQMSSSTGKITTTPTKELTAFRLFLSGDYDCEFKLQIEFGSSVTTWTPYSNICPITAYTEGEIEVRGKNLADFVDGKGIGNDGLPDNSADRSGTVNPITVVSGKSYIFTSVDGSKAIYAVWSGETLLRRTSNISSGTELNVLDGDRFYICVYLADGTASIATSKPMVRYSDTSDEYEPYTSTTHTTTYPSAIYRGSEDVVNGTVGAGSDGEEWIVADLGDLTWYASTDASGQYFYATITGIKRSTSGETLPFAICENYAPTKSNIVSDGQFAISSNLYRIFVRDTRYSTTSDFTTAVTGVKLAYELATPTTTPVTPTNLPIKSLSGYNHIESSTGDMTIDYITDAYQNFVDTVESALPNTTRNLLSASKGGTKAMDIFLSLEKRSDKEEEVKEETKDDMR